MTKLWYMNNITLYLNVPKFCSGCSYQPICVNHSAQKSKVIYRNRLTNFHLDGILRARCRSYESDLNEIIKKNMNDMITFILWGINTRILLLFYLLCCSPSEIAFMCMWLEKKKRLTMAALDIIYISYLLYIVNTPRSVKYLLLKLYSKIYI